MRNKIITKKIKKIMIDQDVTISSLAKITGYSRAHLSNVINRNVDSLKVKKIIALILNIKFKELWDDLTDSKS